MAFPLEYVDENKYAMFVAFPWEYVDENKYGLPLMTNHTGESRKRHMFHLRNPGIFHTCTVSHMFHLRNLGSWNISYSFIFAGIQW